MSGIMEAILAELQSINARLAAGAGQTNGAAVVQQQPVDPFAPATTHTPPAQVTEAQVMALIEPHLENQPLKAGLQQVLAAMGIARLPEARPDQYAELYQRFTGVIQQFANPAGAGASII